MTMIVIARLIQNTQIQPGKLDPQLFSRALFAGDIITRQLVFFFLFYY